MKIYAVLLSTTPADKIGQSSHTGLTSVYQSKEDAIKLIISNGYTKIDDDTFSKTKDGFRYLQKIVETNFFEKMPERVWR